MTIHTLVFNPFQENTYILAGPSGKAYVIDPGMHDAGEEEALDALVRKEGWQIEAVINTHCHIDHILGNEYVREAYRAPLWIHPAGEGFLKHGHEHARVYGFDIDPLSPADRFLEDGEVLDLDGAMVEVLYTPGHADGSICLHIPSMKAVIVGDVLFNGSIGRTDLPSGNYELLIRSIKDKLLRLPPETSVYPGHGPATTIGFEAGTNPFLTGR